MTPQLKDRTALVTGSASGIGYAIAVGLARAGAKLVLTDLDEKQAQAVCLETGGYFIPSDLSSRHSCQELAEEALQKCGKIDILINNAGFQTVSPIEEFPIETWEKMLSVMLTAPFQLSQAFWPKMRTQNWGRIINIASVHGLVASPFKSAYVTAKHGLLGFTKTAALEGGAFGITANSICPAYVRTPLVDQQIASQAKNLGIPAEEVVRQVMLEPAAIKRLIEPKEVADLALYLCSDSASAVTGSNWNIDLGWTAR